MLYIMFMLSFRERIYALIRTLQTLSWAFLIPATREVEFIVHRTVLFPAVALIKLKYSDVALVDLFVVDRPRYSCRFYVKYAFLCGAEVRRVLIGTFTSAGAGVISISGLFSGLQ
jgi:hypothetical protein